MFDSAFADHLEAQPNEQAAFLLASNGDRAALSDYDTLVSHHGADEVSLVFLDASSAAALSWPARNMLTFLSVRFGVTSIRVVAWRGGIASSKVVDVTIQEPLKSKSPAVGWEKNANGKLSPRLADLGPMMDPTRCGPLPALQDCRTRLILFRTEQAGGSSSGSQLEAHEVAHLA